MKLLRNGVGVFPIHTMKYIKEIISSWCTSKNCYKNNVLNQRVSSAFGRIESGLKFDLKMKISVILLIFGAFVLQAKPAYAQKKISLNLENVTVERFLDEIESKTDFRFIYSTDDVDIDRLISLVVDEEPVDMVLDRVFTGTKTNFNIDDEQIFLLANKNPEPKSNQNSLQQTQIRITGTVTDENGIPLNGASVIVRGTSIGVSTDFDGRYEIAVPNKESILVFTYIGYEDQQITVGDQFSINVTMQEAVGQLDEVVVSTGYWQEQRKLSTGNIGKIDSKIIERQPVSNPLQALQGQVAGVEIQQTSGIPGSAINIRIRGQNSLNDGQILRGSDGSRLDLPNSNEPFYVVDGVPFPASSINTAGLTSFGNSPLATLRPEDIESIEVLKDADATSIYGSRGANGVILITTKKGEAGKTKVTLDYSMGLGQVPNRVDLLNTQQYLMLRREGIVNDGIPLTAQDSIRRPDLFLWDPNRDVDWQETLFGGTAEQTNASFSISGGSERTNYLFRGNYFRQTNVFNFDDSSIESGSGVFNMDHTSKDNRFGINSSVTYSLTQNNQNGGFTVDDAITLPPNAPELFDENGDVNFEENFIDNPLIELGREYENRSKNLIASLSLRYQLLPGLVLRSTFGYNDLSSDELGIIPLSTFSPESDSDGQSRIARNNVETWTIEPQLDYSSNIGKGTFKVLIGGSLQSTNNRGLVIRGRGFDSDLLLSNLAAAPEVSVLTDISSQFRYTAVFGRINYNWQDRYIINLTGRRDGSSRFGPGNRFGNFGAVGLAWIFSNERFIGDNSIISFGKLRGSYGLTGNDQIGDYQFLSSYSSDSDGGTLGYDGNSALLRSRAANPNFSWEENQKLEVGLELGFINNNIRLNTSWFQNRSDNQLVGRPLSTVTGFSTVLFNFPALVENRGIEIELSTVNINSKDFTWTSALNFSRLRNELLEFPNIEDFSAFDNRYIVGRSLLGSKQFKTNGINPETGEGNTVDFNGDGRIDVQDQQDFVEIFRDFFGGLNNTLRWKSLEFSFFLNFVKQNGLDFFPNPGGFGNQPQRALERWQRPGDVTSIQRSSSRGSVLGLQGNAGLTDASFVRLQNVSLAWTLPSKIVSQIGLENARVYLNGQNLLTITDFNGLDPETGNTNLPPLRVITTGIQLTF